MKKENHIYIAIDLKSFYASVECVERGLDPLTTNLVVADASRTEKTICLAVSPSLKAFGIPGRARLFQVVQRVREENTVRRSRAPHGVLTGSSYLAKELKESPELALDYIAAPPRMAKYMAYSTRIYHIYLKYVAPEDIHVYSIDEVFMDVTHYLKTANLSPREFAMKMINEVFQTIGITATAGIATNLYLCKIAMDIVAKHMPADENGVRIAQLDELSYRQMLWTHTPLTDFWRIGPGYAKKLEENGMLTMGDVARCSIGKSNEYFNEDLLYRLFGINAELIIDHAWGYEPCTIADVKAYKPTTNSVGAGQVLQSPYVYEKAKLIVREMTDLLVLDLVGKGLVTNQIVLTVGYDVENLTNPKIRSQYRGQVTTDYYGRQVPKHAHGTANFLQHTSSTKIIIDGVMDLYTRIADEHLLVRRINISANHVVGENNFVKEKSYEQLDLFTDYEAKQQERKKEEAELQREKKMQLAILEIKNRYGKNAILKGTNLEEGATTMERNKQIGGHKE
jgi:DNA polymerase V